MVWFAAILALALLSTLLRATRLLTPLAIAALLYIAASLR
jgi:hypothetical protein